MLTPNYFAVPQYINYAPAHHPGFAPPTRHELVLAAKRQHPRFAPPTRHELVLAASWQHPRFAPPTLRELVLAVNRQLAGKLGLDPRLTVSSNIAAIIARTTGLSFTTAKRLFHGGVAGFVAAVLRFFGAGVSAVIAAGAWCWSWLESFDSSAYAR